MYRDHCPVSPCPPDAPIVTPYQDRLAQAERDHIKALTDYHVAITNLDKAEGLTLAKNDIVLEEP